MSFPTSPTDGQLYKEYIYNNTLGVWKKLDPAKYFAVGFIYTQYPGMDSPLDLEWYGTWENISSNFAGDFFRAEGGNATSFGSGRQGYHVHSHNHTFSVEQFTEGGSGANHTGIAGSNEPWDAPHEGTGSTNSYGTDETRPVNRTIRIWKRTA